MHDIWKRRPILKNCNSNFWIFTRHPIPMFWNSEWVPPSNSSHGKSRIAIQLPHGSTKQWDLGLTGVGFCLLCRIHHVLMRDSEIPIFYFQSKSWQRYQKPETKFYVLMGICLIDIITLYSMRMYASDLDLLSEDCQFGNALLLTLNPQLLR